MQVLDCVMYSLGLSKHAIRHSLNSLRAMGNMSSGSFLWAYESLLREKIAKPGEFGVFITLGPDLPPDLSPPISHDLP